MHKKVLNKLIAWKIWRYVFILNDILPMYEYENETRGIDIIIAMLTSYGTKHIKSGYSGNYICDTGLSKTKWLRCTDLLSKDM